jgi:hypothetical protein
MISCNLDAVYRRLQQKRVSQSNSVSPIDTQADDGRSIQFFRYNYSR